MQRKRIFFFVKKLKILAQMFYIMSFNNGKLLRPGSSLYSKRSSHQRESAVQGCLNSMLDGVDKAGERTSQASRKTEA